MTGVPINLLPLVSKLLLGNASPRSPASPHHDFPGSTVNIHRTFFSLADYATQPWAIQALTARIAIPALFTLFSQRIMALSSVLSVIRPRRTTGKQHTLPRRVFPNPSLRSKKIPARIRRHCHLQPSRSPQPTAVHALTRLPFAQSFSPAAQRKGHLWSLPPGVI